MTRFQVDLRDMDKVIQGISKMCRLNIKLELKRGNDFYYEHTVKQNICQTNVRCFYILKNR